MRAVHNVEYPCVRCNKMMQKTLGSTLTTSCLHLLSQELGCSFFALGDAGFRAVHHGYQSLARDVRPNNVEPGWASRS